VVTTTPEGYLTRQRGGDASPAQCVHGGTTATVVIVLDAQYLLVANVGDSSGLLVGFDNRSFVRHINEWPAYSAGLASVFAGGGGGGGSGSGEGGPGSLLSAALRLPAVCRRES
jgi:hypothetical protein